MMGSLTVPRAVVEPYDLTPVLRSAYQFARFTSKL